MVAVGSFDPVKSLTVGDLLNSNPPEVDELIPGVRSLLARTRASGESLTQAQSQYRQCMEQFVELRFREALLQNLAREDPLTRPTFADNGADTGPAVSEAQREVSDARGALVRRLAQLEEVAMRLVQGRAQVQERIADLRHSAGTAPTSPGGGSALSDCVHRNAGAVEADRRNEVTAGEQAQELQWLEARKGELRAEAAALQEAVASARGEVEDMEREVEDMERGEAAEGEQEEGEGEGTRQQQQQPGQGGGHGLGAMEGVEDSDLERAIGEEERRASQYVGMRDWFRETAVTVEALGGATVAVAWGGPPDAGLRLSLGLAGGTHTLEVALSPVDGSLTSVALFEEGGGVGRNGSGGGDGAGGGGGGGPSATATAAEVSINDLAEEASRLASPENLRFLAREVPHRLACAALARQHVGLLMKRYLVSYRPRHGEVTVTMRAAVVAGFRLSPDYPKVPGGARLTALAGIGGWSAPEMARLRGRINDLGLVTLMDTMDRLEEAVTALDSEGDSVAAAAGC